MALTAEKEAELVAQGATPEVLRYIKANHEVLDRHDANRQAAEGETAKERGLREAAEKVVADLKAKDMSDLERANTETAKERKAREEAEARADKATGTAIVTKIALKAGAIDENDVMRLLDPSVIGKGEAAIKEAVDGLKAKYPALFGSGEGQYKDGEDHPKGGAPRKVKPDAKECTAAEWGAMKPAEKAAFAGKGGRVVG